MGMLWDASACQQRTASRRIDERRLTADAWEGKESGGRRSRRGAGRDASRSSGSL